MEIIEFETYISKLEDLLKGENKSVIVTSNKTYVLNGLYPTCNIDYCKNNNIEIINTKHFGGTIVNFAGDICIGNYQKEYNDFGNVIITTLMDYLKSKGLNCKSDGNDVLIDDYKCASFMSTNINETIYTAIHISINYDLELIKNICIKEMVKIPKALCDYGITTEEIKNLFLDFANKLK